MLDIVASLQETKILGIKLVAIAIVNFLDFVFTFDERVGFGVEKIDFPDQVIFAAVDGKTLQESFSAGVRFIIDRAMG